MPIGNLPNYREQAGLNALALPLERGGTGWAQGIRNWLKPDPNSTYGSVLPVASSTQYRTPTTLDPQGRAIHGAEQPYTERRLALPSIARETIGNLVNFADAPRAAAMGEMDPTTQENAEMLARGAFDVGAGGMLFNRVPEGALGMFAGRRAATADLDALDKAKKMWGNDAPREDIFRETGWFKGPDEQWRFEIDDSASRIPQRVIDEIAKSDLSWSEGALKSQLEHPEFSGQYPSVGDVRTTMAMDPTAKMSGQYTASTVNGEPVPPSILSIAANPDDLRSVTLHEGQHGVQGVEGFAKGGNISQFEGPISVAKQGMERIDAEMAALEGPRAVARANFDMDKLKELYVQHNALQAQRSEFEAMTDPYKLYKSLAGEVEARNVQARRDMTPEQRRAQPPWETQDVPDIDQIVRFSGMSPTAAAFGGMSPVEQIQEYLDGIRKRPQGGGK